MRPRSSAAVESPGTGADVFVEDFDLDMSKRSKKKKTSRFFFVRRA